MAIFISRKKELLRGNYRHGSYDTFIVTDNKSRMISVASVRDRIVHRLLYEFLLPLYGHTFDYDVWSCRRGKGLVGAIKRLQKLLTKYLRAVVWRCDMTKFFDHEDYGVLVMLLEHRVHDAKAMGVLREVIGSFSVLDRMKGIPIGNLTSQIFANIYLNELDRYVRHSVRPLAYVRYGDDFIIIVRDQSIAKKVRKTVEHFLREVLFLSINQQHDIITIKRGVYFLGVRIYPYGKRFNPRNRKKITDQLCYSNISSYNGLIKAYASSKEYKSFQWKVCEMIKGADFDR